MAAFKVGDKVSIFPPFSIFPVSVSEVRRVSERKLTLADGSSWRVSGYGRWGESSGGYSRSFIRHWIPSHEEQITRRVAIECLRSFAWESLTTERLELIASIIDQHKQEQRAKSQERPV